MRRSPKQIRSQRRVDHILSTAASVFAEMGLEAASTNVIAARSGVPIGSLYQFFPNKEAIWDALVTRYADGMRTLFTIDNADSMSITALISQVVDRLADFEAEHVGFKTIFMASGQAQHVNEETVGQIALLLERRFPVLDPELVQETAKVQFGQVKGLMMLADPVHHLAPGQLREIIKMALIAYLRAVLIKARHPLPPDLDDGGTQW